MGFRGGRVGYHSPDFTLEKEDDNRENNRDNIITTSFSPTNHGYPSNTSNHRRQLPVY